MLQTSKNSDFNQISETYREELDKKKLLLGQTVTFKLLDSRLNPDPDERRKPGKEFIWKQSDYILGKDRIKDPYSNDIVDIGVVKRFDKDGNPLIDKLTVFPSATNGEIVIVGGGDVKKESFYPFMLICNENASNPHRNKDVTPKFKQVNVEAEAEAKNKDFDTLTTMLVFVQNASLAEKREMASAFGWDKDSSEELISRRLREIVMIDAVSFAKTVGNKKDLATKAIINEALAGNVITFAPLENKFNFTATNEVIATFTRSENKEPNDQLLEWLQTNTKGVAVLSNIKKQLKSVELV